MSEDRSSHDPDDKSWIEKFTHVFSSTPKSRQDLLAILKAALKNDVIDSGVYQITDGAIHVADMQVREVMVPRTQMVVIRASQPLREYLPLIVESAHSRYPVISESMDDVLGILLAKDLLPLVLKNNADVDFDIKSILRPVTMVPESKRLNVLLREFRESRSHMAMVIDEYGGVAGLVTIEDVLEEIVGEIEDETDDEEDNFIKKISENDYLVKALTPIADFNEELRANFSEEEFDTIGGILLQQFGHLPRRNETARIGDFEFRVIHADKRQVHLLRMSRVAPAEV